MVVVVGLGVSGSGVHGVHWRQGSGGERKVGIRGGGSWGAVCGDSVRGSRGRFRV